MDIFKKGYQAYKSIFRKGDDVKKALSKKGIGLDLHDVLRNGYQDENERENFGREQGFIYDKELSSPTEQFYYNPETNKLLMNVRGTSSLDDIVTDYELLRGRIKDTKRYQQADQRLREAKQKYSGYDTTITGHSLGGAITQRIAGDDDRVINFNKADVGGKRKPNQIDLRTSGDLISSYGLLGGHAHTINRGSLDNPMDWYATHKSRILKNKGFFI